MNTWELTLSRAAYYDADTIVVITDSGKCHDRTIKDTLARFRLDAEKAGFLFIESNHKGKPKKNWPKRDCKIADMADYLLPVSIRPDGNLERLLNLFSNKIIHEFRIAYRRSRHRRPNYESRRSHPDLPENKFIVHFTRSSAKPWPGETAYDYYRKIVDSKNEYCHCAREALHNILRSKTIYASARNMREGRKVVGFTVLQKDKLSRLFRYRPRLVNPYFEPYGLGISIAAASACGIRPVRYGSKDDYHELNHAQKFYFQNEGGDGGRWRSENEWRLRGDFHFGQIPESEICLLVPDEDAVEPFSGITCISVIPVLKP